MRRVEAIAIDHKQVNSIPLKFILVLDCNSNFRIFFLECGNSLNQTRSCRKRWK